MALARALAEFYEDSNGDWRWRVKARNAEIVATGESYGSEADAVRGFMAAYHAFMEAYDVEASVTPKERLEEVVDAAG